MSFAMLGSGCPYSTSLPLRLGLLPGPGPAPLPLPLGLASGTMGAGRRSPTAGRSTLTKRQDFPTSRAGMIRDQGQGRGGWGC